MPDWPARGDERSDGTAGSTAFTIGHPFGPRRIPGVVSVLTESDAGGADKLLRIRIVA